jgi:hypothetical protein
MNKTIIKKYSNMAWHLTTLKIRQQIIVELIGGEPLPCPICGSLDYDLTLHDGLLKLHLIECLQCRLIARVEYWPYKIAYGDATAIIKHDFTCMQVIAKGKHSAPAYQADLEHHNACIRAKRARERGKE